MAHVMSPTAPKKETAGLLTAEAYFAKRPNLDGLGVMYYARLIEIGPIAAKQGGDWTRGWIQGAMAIAQQRH